MAEESPKRRDRYDTLGNVETEYVDYAGTVLINRKNITDLETLQTAEEEALARAYEQLLSEIRLRTPMTIELLVHIHGTIFADLYEWGGRWRTVWIQKPGTTWPPPDFLQQSMAAYEGEVLSKFPASSLKVDDAFCAALAEIQGEFLVIHPFREGNARAIKLMTDLLAAQTGRPFLKYDTSQAGKQAYIEAAKAAFQRKYGPMEQIISQALAEAQK
jgi:cell filamentation protein